MQAGTGQVLDGSSRGLSTASMPADSSSKPRNGKDTQTDSGVSMRHSCQTTWERTIENGQQAKQTRRSSFSFKKTANRKTSWCMCTDGPVTKDQSGWGFTVKHGATTIHEYRTSFTVSTSSLIMEVEAVAPALRWTASRGDSRTTHVIILTDSVSLLQKWKWKVQTGMCQRSTLTFENSCGCTLLDMPEWREITQRAK